MAKQFNTPYTFDDATTKSLSIGILNAADLALTADEPDRAVEKNTSSPLDRPETWTFAISDVNDVYKNTSIASASRPSSIRGVQVMVKHESVTQVTDDAAGAENYLKQLPFSVHVVVRTPINELVTADMVLQEVQRTFGGLFGDGKDVSSSRLKDLLNSALKA